MVIVACEPYSLKGKPDGLAYSCADTVDDFEQLPQVLQNILMELKMDLGHELPKHGNLKRWAQQGVLLWNASLTVKKGFPHSHYTLGWDELTKEVLETVYLANPNSVFVFWDAKIRDLAVYIPKDAQRINTPGPAIATAYTGFFKSYPFSKINDILTSTGQVPIDWRIK